MPQYNRKSYCSLTTPHFLSNVNEKYNTEINSMKYFDIQEHTPSSSSKNNNKKIHYFILLLFSFLTFSKEKVFDYLTKNWHFFVKRQLDLITVFWYVANSVFRGKNVGNCL